MGENKFEVMIWENEYPILNNVILFALGLASNGKGIYETFDTLEEANKFYHNYKLHKPKIEDKTYITQEKLLIDNRYYNDITIKKFERRK